MTSGHLQCTDTFAWSRGCPFMTGTTVIISRGKENDELKIPSEILKCESFGYIARIVGYKCRYWICSKPIRRRTYIYKCCMFTSLYFCSITAGSVLLLRRLITFDISYGIIYAAQLWKSGIVYYYDEAQSQCGRHYTMENLSPTQSQKPQWEWTKLN